MSSGLSPGRAHWVGAIRNRTSSARHTRFALALLFALSVTQSSPVDAHQPVEVDIARVSEHIATSDHPARETLIRGEFHRLSGNYAAARADYDRAAALDPRLSDRVELCRAALLIDERRWTEARSTLDHLIAHDSRDPQVWKLSAHVLEQLGRPGEAAADLGRAVANTPNPRPDLYTERARLLSRAGQDVEALAALEEGVARLGPVIGLEMPAAALEQRLGRTAEAAARRQRVAAQRTASSLGEPSVGWPLPSSSLSSSPVVEPSADPVVKRGPYLQVATPTGVTIRWRTDIATTSRVRFGLSLSSLDLVRDDATSTTEHEITLSGLAPDTRYYYSIGTLTRRSAIHVRHRSRDGNPDAHPHLDHRRRRHGFGRTGSGP
jgi:hypothetical protein